ncbi:MAG: DinB family protein [Spirochaetota bacterium]
MTYTSMLSTWAAYTSGANDEMTRILATLPPERLFEAVPSYFKNLAGLIDHGIRGSVFWLKRISDGALMPDWLPSHLADFPLPPQGELGFADLEGFAGTRRRLDACFVELCARGDDAAFSGTFSFLGRDKAERTMEFGAAILTALNHETHHRGGVATILDGWGIENDWSGLMPYVLAKK